MLRLLLSRGTGQLSVGLVLFAWSSRTLLGGSWFTDMVLSFILLLLLVGGTILLVLGVRDLVRDFRRLVHEESPRHEHTPRA